MKCDIYKSNTLDDVFIYVPSKAIPIEILPSSIVEAVGKLELYCSLDLEEDSRLVGDDPEEILKGIEEHGFYVKHPFRKRSPLAHAGAAIGAGILGATLAGPIGAIAGSIVGYAIGELTKGGKLK